MGLISVRKDLKRIFASYGIPYGPGEDVTINNRDYERSESGQSHRIPDARIREIPFDWTLSSKTISSHKSAAFSTPTPNRGRWS